jgi:arginyl-tRNA synthetase
VLKASPEEASTYMFVLLQAKQVIDQSLGLLGIQAKEQM